MKGLSAVKLTCVLEREALAPALSVLADLGAGSLCVQNGRSARLRASRSPVGPAARVRLDESGCEILRAWLPPRAETEVMEAIVERAGLGLPGRGSIYSESVRIFPEIGLGLRKPAAALPAKAASGAARPPSALQDRLIGVSSVVQRGQGNALARSILEMGLSVPCLSYGQGMGLRSKLGLLRVTIPAGKEVVFFMAHRDDAEEALALASETIGLDVPGRGFIYSFPIRKGLADTRIQTDPLGFHVASMEQVIAAIDQLSGGSGWRRRSAQLSAVRDKRRGSARPHRKERNLVNLTLSCADGMAADFLDMTMLLGAGGATLSQAQGLSFREDPEGRRAARESADLILDEEKADGIIEAIEAMGFFAPEVGGMAEISSVAESRAYSSRK